jgi:hypothetical protein
VPTPPPVPHVLAVDDLVAADVLAVVGEQERVGVLERGWCGEAGGVALGLDDALDGVPQLLADAVVVSPEVQLQQGALGMMASATRSSIVATLAEVTGIAFEPEVAPAVPATRPGSSRPGSTLPATSIGRCATTMSDMVLSAWSAARSWLR